MTLQTTSRLEVEIGQQQGALREVLPAQAVPLQAAREAVGRSSRALLVGIGSSRHVAAYGASCLEALTATPVSLLAAPGAGISLPALTSGDVLIVVSQSGRTPALLPLVAAARAARATVISLTNAERSPLAAVADIALVTGAGPEQVVPATKSVTTSMLLLRALAAPITPSSVAALSDAVARTTGSPDLARAAATHPVPQVVVAGGFAAEAVSDEVALKLAEVTARLAVAETVVDYLHGPAAVPAPVLAFLDPLDPNTAAFASRPHVLRVGTDPAYDLVQPGTGEPTLDAIVRVVTGQCLALRWAEQLGLDPDDPRGLDKVTHTL